MPRKRIHAEGVTPVAVRLPGDLYIALRDIAEAQERTLAGAARLAIRRYVEAEQAERQEQPA